MSEIDDCDQLKVLNIIKKNPGCSYDYIYKESDIEKTDLSRILHRLIQLMDIHKVNSCYSAVGTEKSSEVKAKVIAQPLICKPGNTDIAQVVGTQLDNNSTLTTTTNHTGPSEFAVKELGLNIKPTKLYGKLHRSGDKGIIAYYLYKTTKNGIFVASNLIRDNLKSLNINIGNLSTILWSLALEGYLVKPEDNSSFYKWGTKYVYPFSKLLDGDWKIGGGFELKLAGERKIVNIGTEVIGDESDSTKSPSIQLHIAPTGNTEDTALKLLPDFKNIIEDKRIHNALATIDSRINSLQEEIDNLMKIKDCLLPK